MSKGIAKLKSPELEYRMVSESGPVVLKHPDGKVESIPLEVFMKDFEVVNVLPDEILGAPSEEPEKV